MNFNRTLSGPLATMTSPLGFAAFKEGEGEGGGEAEAEGQEGEDQEGEGSEGEGEEDPGEKPDWLPAKFWGEDGPNYENLAKSYGELEKGRVDPEKLKEEWEAKRLEGRPEAPADYALPKDERFDAEALAASPVVGLWRDAAHDMGLNQEQFDAVLVKYADTEIERITAFAEAQKEELGETADDRIKSVDAWAQKHFSDEEYGAISQIATTASGVKTLEKMMKMTGSSSMENLGNGDGSGAQGDTEAEIMALMDTPAYYDPARKDPKVIQRVEAFFARKK